MGFFKDFKEDFSQAVNELSLESESKKKKKVVPIKDEDFDDEQMINTLDDDMFKVESDLEDDFSWLEDDEIVKIDLEETSTDGDASKINKVAADAENVTQDTESQDEIISDLEGDIDSQDAEFEDIDEFAEFEDLEDIDEFEDTNELNELNDLDDLDTLSDIDFQDELTDFDEELTDMDDDTLVHEEDIYDDEEISMEDYEVEEMMNEGTKEYIAETDAIVEANVNDLAPKTEKRVADEVTIIGKDTRITGNISSDGSIDFQGTIVGDIECLGKLSVSGSVKGNSVASEVFINATRLEGSIRSEGCVKVGVGTVIIGDVTATSGVIAGAIKGQIDVNGAIVLDSTAIVKGNINAKSVQINNGAVVDGYCSLSYASVDIDNVFEEEK